MSWARGLRGLVTNCRPVGEAFKSDGSWHYSVNMHKIGFHADNSSFFEAHHFTTSSQGNEPCLDRDFSVQLWNKDKRLKKCLEKRRRKNVFDKYDYSNNGISDTRFSRSVSGAYSNNVNYDEVKLALQQPPVSQSVTGSLKPTSPEEVQIAPLLARSNLLITRDIEWANLALGIKQESRYAIVDVCYPQSPVGLIREKSNLFARQFLRSRRPFMASISDALDNDLFSVRRPFWWITSSIYAEINGKEVGVVHRRWHLWRRIYDLYLGDKQFAVVENPGFWNWTFTLKDVDGKVMGEIDRNWRGFGFEILTDAGQYVIRFGTADPLSKTGIAKEIEELDVGRSLTLSERAVTVALAISLDSDYFSRHSGWGIPLVAVGE